MKAKEAKEWLQVAGIIIGAFILLKLFNTLGRGFSSIGESLGITNDPEEQKAVDKKKLLVNNEIKAGDNSAFSKNYWVKKLVSKMKQQVYSFPTMKKIDDIVLRINKAIGIFKDNPADVENAFAEIKDKIMLSMVAFYFHKKYNKDLLKFLSEKLDNGDQSQTLVDVINFANALPIGLRSGSEKELKAWQAVAKAISNITGVKIPY